MIDNKRFKQRAKLTRPLLIPFILYIGLLRAVTSWAPTIETSLLRYTVALLPIIPGIWLALGAIRLATQLDELERRILLEAATLSFSLTLLLLVSLGLLGMVGVPAPDPMIMAAIMAILFIIGKLWGNQRTQ